MASRAVETRQGLAGAGRVALAALGSRWNRSPDARLVAGAAGKWQGIEPILFTSGAEISLYQIPGAITEHIPYDSEAPERDLLFAARKLTDLFWKWRISEVHPVDEESARAWGLIGDHATEPAGWPPMRMTIPEV